jgi:hypothetical protein
LHLNGKGKERMADKIAKIFDDIINMKQWAPTMMKWKEEEPIRTDYQEIVT